MASSLVIRLPALQSKEAIMLARDIGLPLALFSIAHALPESTVLLIYICIGWGHLYMAPLYQYRSGKVNARYLSVVAVLVVLTLAYFVLFDSNISLFVLTVAFFGLHGAVDEFYLHGETLTWRGAITVAAFAALFAVVSLLPRWPVFAVFLPYIAAIVGVAFLLRLLVLKELPSRTELYLLYMGLLIGAFTYNASLYTTIAVVSLLHYANWYIGYGIKVNDMPPRRVQYWREVALFTVAGFGFYYLYMLGVPALKYFFDPYYYTAWTLWHFVLSSRWVSGLKKPLFG
ncbi:MAG: hypothetical protein ABA06_04165 [Parcubacteria bacterium C7867-001]|nr:MAG: hypothetical protein ABA06_04165 [Parcubacteria bacterium C7867-001]